MRSAVWTNADYPVTQPFTLAVHDGIDIGMPAGTLIYAARAGIVERVQAGMVGIRVGTQRDFYLHGTSLVAVGQAVAQGKPVIRSGAVTVDPRYPVTGPHLHFEVQNGYSLPGAPPNLNGAPLNPVPFLLAAVAFGEASHLEESMSLTDPHVANVLSRIVRILATGDEPSPETLAADVSACSPSEDAAVTHLVAVLAVGAPYLAKVRAAVAAQPPDPSKLATKDDLAQVAAKIPTKVAVSATLS